MNSSMSSQVSLVCQESRWQSLKIETQSQFLSAGLPRSLRAGSWTATYNADTMDVPLMSRANASRVRKQMLSWSKLSCRGSPTA